VCLGVCDCCDGSDEYDSPFQPACYNSCEDELVLMKRMALNSYRNVQSGLRTQAELTNSLKSKKMQEMSLIKKLREERDDIHSMFYTMMVLLRENAARETELHFQLLRERENRCAAGIESACEYFHSEYFDEDELMHTGYPLEYAKPRQRLHYEHSAADLEYVSKLSGLERVRMELCPLKTLLPDDDARIYTRVGEYITFMKSEVLYSFAHHLQFSGLFECLKSGDIIGI
jgi:hypothetical protein